MARRLPAPCWRSATCLGALPGQADREPVFGLEAKWIPASSCGTRPSSAAPPSSTAPRSSPPTWPRSSPATPPGCSAARTCRMLTDVVKRSHPVVVEELTPAQLSLGEVQRVLQSLLDEKVLDPRPRADLRGAVAARHPRTRTSTDWSSPRAHALGPAIVAPYIVGTDACTSSPSSPRSSSACSRRSARHRARPRHRPGPRLSDSRCSWTSPGSPPTRRTSNLRPVLDVRSADPAGPPPDDPPDLDRLPVLSYPELLGAGNVRSLGVVPAEVHAGALA